MYKLSQITKGIFNIYLKRFDEDKILSDDISKYNNDIINGMPVYFCLYINKDEPVAIKKLILTQSQKIFHSTIIIKKEYRGKNIRDLCMYIPSIILDYNKIITDTTIHFTMSLGRREKLWIRRGWKIFKHYEMRTFTEISNSEFSKLCEINSNNVITTCYISHAQLKVSPSYTNVLNDKNIYYENNIKFT